MEPGLLDSIVQQTAAALDELTLVQTRDLPRLREGEINPATETR